MIFVWLLLIAVSLHILDWWFEERRKDTLMEIAREEFMRKMGRRGAEGLR